MTDIRHIERLFKENYPRLFSLAFMMLKDEGAAHDAVQDVFADLLQSDSGHIVRQGYLVRCVRNRCLNIIRDLPPEERVERLVMTPDGVELFYDSGLSSLVDGDEDGNRIGRIRDMISDELPTQCSRVMRLRFESGLSYSDIAEELGVSKAAVYKHLRHGLDYIRKNLNL